MYFYLYKVSYHAQTLNYVAQLKGDAQCLGDSPSLTDIVGRVVRDDNKNCNPDYKGPKTKNKDVRLSTPQSYVKTFGIDGRSDLPEAAKKRIQHWYDEGDILLCLNVDADETDCYMVIQTKL